MYLQGQQLIQAPLKIQGSLGGGLTLTMHQVDTQATLSITCDIQLHDRCIQDLTWGFARKVTGTMMHQ